MIQPQLNIQCWVTLKSDLQLLEHGPLLLFTCVGCLVMSLIIVKLKVHACKFRKSSLGFQNRILCSYSEAARLHAYTVFLLI